MKPPSANRPAVLVELDGTLAEAYWDTRDGSAYDPLVIGKPVHAMVTRIHQHLADGDAVVVYTARIEPHLHRPGFDPPEYLAGLIEAEIWAWTAHHLGTALRATHDRDGHLGPFYSTRAVRIPPCPAAADASA